MLKNTVQGGSDKMMKKRILSLVLLFALIIAAVSCSRKPKNFPVELATPEKILALSCFSSTFYGIEDSKKIKKLVDMLNQCTYEIHEKELEFDVDYKLSLYNPWSLTFEYKNDENLHIEIYLEGYMYYYYDANEISDIYKVSGFDKEIFCDAIGLSLSAVENY